jgi:hypothetical protein
MSMETNEQVDKQLEEFRLLVKKYRICWEVWPEYFMVDGNKRQVGFELVLAGTHEEETHQTPACPKCLDLFQHLKVIADWLPPDEQRQAMYEIQPYDSSIHRAVKRNLRPEVTLSLKILHRRGYDQPVDACEVDCLNEMQDKLNNIGAQRDVWQESK